MTKPKVGDDMNWPNGWHVRVREDDELLTWRHGKIARRVRYDDHYGCPVYAVELEDGREINQLAILILPNG